MSDSGEADIPDHPLDRPAWSALTSRQGGLALGNDRALRFDPDYALFAAAADDSTEAIAALGRLNSSTGLGLVEARQTALPPGAVVLKQAACVQMTATEITHAATTFAIEALTEADAPQMLALATLTEPGPFFRRTHQLGDFVGVKQDGRLIAMAGERMKPDGFTEVSGVCTHPDHRGRGYAGALMRIVATRILDRHEMPFLHAYTANSGAISLYQSLGFSVRSPITFTVLGGTGSVDPG
ncbi:GNAT family N-acetyltransferase [uncultured Brevundimonas sp.]|uniref:GNAT family N-acetyltransferase n=1 Tax=uncultured Brevundimonas sp. TaxID=213418 RepID=UPI0030EBF63F